MEYANPAHICFFRGQLLSILIWNAELGYNSCAVPSPHNLWSFIALISKLVEHTAGLTETALKGWKDINFQNSRFGYPLQV